MPDFLLVKWGAGGDVLLTTAMLRDLRAAAPGARLAWMSGEAYAPLLAGNPDLDDLITARGGRPGTVLLRRARRWRRSHPTAVVLLAHRRPAWRWWLRAAGFRKIIGFDHPVAFDPALHRIELHRRLLAAAGLALGAAGAPRMELTSSERAAGAWHWSGEPAAARRWVLACGGGRNSWSRMPNRLWPRERFAALGATARGAGIAVRLIGDQGDSADAAWIAGRMAAPATVNLAGRLSLRQSAAVIAAADVVIGNDSLPLVMAHALGRPGVGLYGPTDGGAIHNPAQGLIQGRAGCGPCYDPRAGTGGRAYRCPRARCMETITPAAVWRLALSAEAIS